MILLHLKLKMKLEDQLDNFEPRVSITSLDVTANIDGNEFECCISL